ncbi:MAG TPA: porin family protein [Chitinophagaceae bacterium]|jgi:hypothetical protein|nr:porin family protein [Chitinophagaceae bacterium]
MLYLSWTKTGSKSIARLCVVLLTVLSFSFTAAAQRILHLEEHDNKPYYFGITLGINQGSFKTELHERFLQQDSILVAEPLRNGGITLGLVATARLSNRFEGRFNPQLMFSERNLFYRMRYADRDFGDSIVKRIESVIVSFPLQLKFRSDRIGNFRVYMLGGGKLDYDLASNAKARKADDMVKINKISMGLEAGAGFNFYFPSFILSPEIKISNGLNNIHSRDLNLNYSNILDRIQSRMIVFSIHIEG